MCDGCVEFSGKMPSHWSWPFPLIYPHRVGLARYRKLTTSSTVATEATTSSTTSSAVAAKATTSAAASTARTVWRRGRQQG